MRTGSRGSPAVGGDGQGLLELLYAVLQLPDSLPELLPQVLFEVASRSDLLRQLLDLPLGFDLRDGLPHVGFAARVTGLPFQRPFGLSSRGSFSLDSLLQELNLLFQGLHVLSNFSSCELGPLATGLLLQAPSQAFLQLLSHSLGFLFLLGTARDHLSQFTPQRGDHVVLLIRVPLSGHPHCVQFLAET